MKTLFPCFVSACILILISTNVVSAADTLTVVLEPDKDAFICDCQPDATNPGGPPTKLFQGQYSIGGKLCYARTPMHWNLAILPQNTSILSATVNLTCTMIYGTLTGQMAFYRFIQNWDGTTVTHNNAPQYTTEDPVILNWPTVTGQLISVNVTELVKFWYVQSDSNFGILGHSVNTTGTGSGAIGYYSSRYTNTAQQPQLVITYTTNATSVRSETRNLPQFFQLKAYPNPFNPMTNITYSLEESSWVSLDVIDIKGRLVDHLFTSHQERGEHLVQWNASRFSSGIYLISITNGEQRATKKVILMK